MDGWPSITELGPLFSAKAWSRWEGDDEWVLRIEGLYGTDCLPEDSQVRACLIITGTPDFGVMLHYSRWDGRTQRSLDCYSKGDMDRIRQWLRTLQEDLRPIGLFIPYAQAWTAVREFMERDGELPSGIEWIGGNELPPNTFRFPGFFNGPEPRVLTDEDINDVAPRSLSEIAQRRN
ncbi:hypothetical protein [Rhodopseudomonas sp. B29]|uniref:hypothetical protein n=1 Tax=Rhodopseudomonas sp. B29 TaxID=95607 RepID=UPI001FCA9328|nr:hypothetical protein [Rhodopseudomonas sp. B29]